MVGPENGRFLNDGIRTVFADVHRWVGVRKGPKMYRGNIWILQKGGKGNPRFKAPSYAYG
jgi:hypothetical protein